MQCQLVCTTRMESFKVELKCAKKANQRVNIQTTLRGVNIQNLLSASVCFNLIKDRVVPGSPAPCLQSGQLCSETERIAALVAVS